MISAVLIQSLKLPRRFIFDSLSLYAKFVSASAELFALKFNHSAFQKERTLNLNVQVKIPASRSQFTLVLQVKIINMDIPCVEVPIDFNAMGEWNQYQLIFQTEMGSVAMDISFIEEIYLPKQETKTILRRCVAENARNSRQDSIRSEESLVENYHMMRSNEGNRERQGFKQLEKERQILRKHFSSRRQLSKKPEKLNLSRSEYMKLEIDESLLESDGGNAETESDLKPKKSAVS